MHSFLSFRLPRLRNNPVLKRELIDMLRKRSAFVSLGCFLVISLLILLAVWNQSIRSVQSFESLSRSFRWGMMFFQTCFVLFLVPTLSAVKINLEIENETWELLRTTPLSQADILLGKWFSSVLYIWLLMIALIPFLGILFPMGGFSPREMLFHFVLISETVLLTSLFGLACSAWGRHTIQSIVTTYFFVLLYYAALPLWAQYNQFQNDPLRLIDEAVTALSPFNLFVLFQYGTNPITFTRVSPWLLHAMGVFAVSGVLWWICILGLRRRTGESWLKALLGRSVSGTRSAHLRTRPFQIRDNVNPVLAKEMHQLMGKSVFNRWIYNLTLLFLGLFLIYLHTTDSVRGFRWSPIFYLSAIFLTPILCIPAAVNAFRLEKDQDTWNLLRSTPLTSHQFVWGKLRACLMSYSVRFLCFYGVIFLAGLLIEPFLGWFGPQRAGMLDRHRITVVVSLWLNFVWAFFYIGFSLLFSVSSRNTQSAYIKSLLLPLGFFFLWPAILFLSTFDSQAFLTAAGFFSPVFLLLDTYQSNVSGILCCAFIQTFFMLLSTLLALSSIQDRLADPDWQPPEYADGKSSLCQNNNR